MRILFFAVVASLVFGCDRAPTFPDPPPIVEPPPVTEDPRVDVDFDLEGYKGIIAFGLGHPGQSKQDVINFVTNATNHGVYTIQPCSETEFWDGSFQYPQKPRDPERLNWLLDILSRIPGVQVALVGNCTLKRQVPLSEQLEWARQVAEVAQEYKNVAIFTHNEFDNCRHRDDWEGRKEYCAGKEDVAQHIRLYKSYGFKYVTADDSFSPPVRGDSGQRTYGFRLANIGAIPASFHPAREKDGRPWDPSLHQLQQLGRFNGDYILSETVAWADFSGRCDGLRTCDQDRIQDFVDRCVQVPECKFTFHCEACLNGEVPTFTPLMR